MKSFLYITFLVLFLGVIGVASYVFVQFGGIRYFTYQLGKEDVRLIPEDITFKAQEGVVNGVYVIDINASTVTWSGSRPNIRNITHRGTVGIEKGELVVLGASSTGSISLSMQNLTILDEDDTAKEALPSLLSGPSFFNSEKYPSAYFNITRMEKQNENTNIFTIFATLEMRGQVRELSFPATIYMRDDRLRAVADFSLNRLEWGMTYNSESVLGKLAENAIADIVEVSLDITATPVTAVQ